MPSCSGVWIPGRNWRDVMDHDHIRVYAGFVPFFAMFYHDLRPLREICAETA